MKNILKIVIVIVSLAYAVSAFSGQLVYRDGELNAGCNIVTSIPLKSVPRAGPMPDKSRTTYTLKCNSRTISVRTIPSLVCPPRGEGCYRPPLEECNPRGGGCKSLDERTNDTVNYDFNYDLPGVDIMFGSVSAKSTANVFVARPLSKNYIAYSSDGVLDKPVIIVEGYDPDNSVFPSYYFHYGFDQLVNKGRDLIVVNFPNGSASLTENAVLLQKIILEINAAKVGSYPAAVIGYSMGGIVARKALKNMELAGVAHNTSLYVSFDAPHMGANLPLALEETIEGLISKLDSATAGYTSSSLKRARNIYNSPAAKEMLLTGSSFKAAVPADFPEKLTRVATTSGSLLGIYGMQSPSTFEGEYIAGFRFYLYDSSIATLSKSFDWYSKRRGNIYYDNVPGSYEWQFRDAYFNLKSAAASFSAYTEPKPQKITFVPTFSALAMTTEPTIYLKDKFQVKSPFDKYIAADESSGLDPCTAFKLQVANGVNLVHHPVNEYFNYSQLMQMNCALDQYQVVNAPIPNRSFKQY